jgi:hypothetical protein
MCEHSARHTFLVSSLVQTGTTVKLRPLKNGQLAAFAVHVDQAHAPSLQNLIEGDSWYADQIPLRNLDN